MVFQKGDPPGPGRPKYPEDLKEAKRITAIDFQNLIYKLFEKNRSELEEIMRHPHTSMKELLIASIMEKAIIHGDPIRMEWLTIKIFGKENVRELNAIDAVDSEMLRQIPSEEIIKLIKEKN